jgi:hypothetical protein
MFVTEFRGCDRRTPSAIPKFGIHHQLLLHPLEFSLVVIARLVVYFKDDSRWRIVPQVQYAIEHPPDSDPPLPPN